MKIKKKKKKVVQLLTEKCDNVKRLLDVHILIMFYPIMLSITARLGLISRSGPKLSSLIGFRSLMQL